MKLKKRVSHLLLSIILLVSYANLVHSQSVLSGTSKNTQKNIDENWRDYKNRLLARPPLDSNTTTTNDSTTTTKPLRKPEPVIIKLKASKSSFNSTHDLTSNNSSIGLSKNQLNASTTDSQAGAKTNSSSLDEILVETTHATSIINNNSQNGQNENKVLRFLKGQLDRIDRYTLIMTSAFLIGLVCIGAVIACSVCICKYVGKFHRERKSKKQSNELVNPKYDFTHIKTNNPDTDFLSEIATPRPPTIYTKSDEEKKKRNELFNDHTPKSKNSSIDEKKALLNQEDIEMQILVDQAGKNDNNHQTTISSPSTPSSSASSIDSFINKTPKSVLINKNMIPNSPLTPPKSASILDSTPVKAPKSTPASTFKSSLSNLAQKLSGSKPKVDDFLENNSNSASRYTPNLRDKTNQQKSKEVQNSRRSLYNRTTSETEHPFDQLPPMGPSSKRASVISSTSSIGLPNRSIDFGLVKTDVDDLLNDMSLLKSSVSKSSDVNREENESRTNSVSNIYMDAMRQRIEAMNKTGGKSGGATNTNAMDISDLSVSVNLNPGGGGGSRGGNMNRSRGNLASEKSYDKGSVNTLGSEKSCY